MFVPVYSDSAIGQALEAAVQRHILPDALLVLADELPGAVHRGLFFNREHKDKIGACPDARFVEGSHRCKNCFEVSRVIAYTGREYLSITHLCLDIQPFLEHCIQVGVDHDCTSLAYAFSHRYEVSPRVVINPVKMKIPEQA